MDYIQQIKKEQNTILYGLLAGFIASFFINKSDPTLIGVATHEITIGLLFAGVLFSFIIKAILNRSIMNLSFIKNNIKSNYLILVPIVVILLVLLSPQTELFSFVGVTIVGSILKWFLKIFGIGGASTLGNVGTVGGITALIGAPATATTAATGIGAWGVAVLLGLPIILSIISILVFFFLFREPISALSSILTTISNNLLIVVVIIVVIVVLYLMIGKRQTVTSISKEA